MKILSILFRVIQIQSSQNFDSPLYMTRACQVPLLSIANSGVMFSTVPLRYTNVLAVRHILSDFNTSLESPDIVVQVNDPTYEQPVQMT